NGDVELGLLRQRHRFVDPSGFAGKSVTEVIQHVLQQHADHQFVLDHEDALAGRTAFAHPGIHVPPYPKFTSVVRGAATIEVWPSGPTNTCNARNALAERSVPPAGHSLLLPGRYKPPAGMLEHNLRRGSGVTMTDIRAADVERMEFQLALRRRGISDQSV